MPIYLGNTQIGKEYVDSYQTPRIFQGTQLIQNEGYGPVPLQNLYALWDASNTSSYPGSGSTWYDLSGNNNHLTLTGSITSSSLSLGFNFPFPQSSSYAFKETGSTWTGTEMTVCMWTKIKTSGLNLPVTEPYPLIIWNNTDVNSAWNSFGYISSGGGYKITNTIANSLSSSQGYQGDSLDYFFYDQQWVFTSFTISGSIPASGYPKAFRQGNNISYSKTSGQPSGSLFVISNPGLYLGSGVTLFGSTSYNFVGDISYVSIYNKALTDLDINDIFQNTKGKFQL